MRCESSALVHVSHTPRYAEFGPEEMEEFRWRCVEEDGVDVQGGRLVPAESFSDNLTSVREGVRPGGLLDEICGGSFTASQHRSNEVEGKKVNSYFLLNPAPY